jgi:hypothetical protein
LWDDQHVWESEATAYKLEFTRPEQNDQMLYSMFTYIS